MSADTNPGKGLLSDEQVGKLDHILQEDPTQIPQIIDAAQSGDVVALDYMMRSKYGVFAAEGFKTDVQGNVTAIRASIMPRRKK